MPLYFLMAIFPCTTGSHCRQVTIFLENVRFRNMRIMTLISVVSWLPMASSTSPFTYGAVEVIFGSIYFYFHLQTAPDLQDCPHSTNLPTIPESTLYIFLVQFKSSCHKISNSRICKFTLASQRIDASIVEGSGIIFCIRFVDFAIYFDLENSSILNNKI